MGRNRNTKTEKECVTIRFKSLKSGNKSIYLDCYSKGERTYEFLKLYLVPETSQDAIDANNEVMAKAEAIRAERELQYSKQDEVQDVVEEPVISTGQTLIHPSSRAKSTILLIDMIRIYGMAYEIKGTRSAADNAKSLVCAIEQYGAQNVTLDDVNTAFCTKFVRFLKTNCVSKRGKQITASTAEAWYGVLSSALSMAMNLNFISTNPVANMDSSDKVKRTYSKHLILSLDDIHRLEDIAFPSKRVQIKNAFLFACYTGIKEGELRKLCWKDITLDSEQWILHIADRNLDIPLSNEAIQWLPKRGRFKSNDLVFNNIPCNVAIQNAINDWMRVANIEDDIKFSTAYHSYEYHYAKSREQIKADNKDASRHTRWRLNKIAKRAKENAIVAKPVTDKVETIDLPLDALDSLFEQ